MIYLITLQTYIEFIIDLVACNLLVYIFIKKVKCNKYLNLFLFKDFLVMQFFCSNVLEWYENPCK